MFLFSKISTWSLLKTHSAKKNYEGNLLLPRDYTLQVYVQDIGILCRTEYVLTIYWLVGCVCLFYI